MDPAQRLLVMLVATPATQGGERGEETVELYVSVSALLSSVRAIRVPTVGQVAPPHTPDMARVLRVTAPHFLLPSAVHPSCFGVCGMRAVFSRPTWHKGQLVLRVADYHAGRVARSYAPLPEAPRRASRVYFSEEDTRELGRGRRGGRIGQTQHVLRGTVSRDGRTAAVNNARPARRYFERSVPLPWSMQVDNGLSVSSVLCEDSILFFQVSGDTHAGFCGQVTDAMCSANPRTRYYSRRVLLCVLSASLSRRAVQRKFGVKCNFTPVGILSRSLCCCTKALEINGCVPSFSTEISSHRSVTDKYWVSGIVQ